MTRGMLMVLVATAMAVLLAGCGSSQREAQDSSQGSEQEEGSSQQTSEPTTNEQTAEPTTTEGVVGRCADSGSTGGQQEQASGGEVSNGKIAFTRITAPPNRNWLGGVYDIYVVDGEGAHECRLTHTAQLSEQDPVWSPDGQKIAFTTADHSTLSVINVDGTHKVSLITTAFAGNAENRTGFESPVWSPTGNKIAFASSTYEEGYASSSASASAASFTVKGLTGIYQINVDGTGLRKVTNTETGVSSLVLSPNGEQIAFYDSDIMGDPIEVINTDGSGRKELVEGHTAAWSPDDQKIAFVNDSRLPNVHLLQVINADGSGLRRLTNTIGGMRPNATLPAWSPDGEEIAFPCSADPGAEAHDLCVIKLDGRERKRIAFNVATSVRVSWARW